MLDYIPKGCSVNSGGNWTVYLNVFEGNLNNSHELYEEDQFTQICKGVDPDDPVQAYVPRTSTTVPIGNSNFLVSFLCK